MSSSHEKVSKITVKPSTLSDSWVTCNSTSHPGLKFYVNQRTGIKVWNITESEIKYAEKASKEGAEPHRRPKMNHPEKEKIYNKQIINNQFSNQLSNLLVNTVPISPFNVWDNPQNLPPQVHPQQSYTLVPTAVAEAYQRFLPLPNNVQCQYNASLQMPYNSKQNQPQRWTPRSSRRRYNKWNRGNEFSHSHNNTDLREKLVRRKSISESLNENEEDVIKEKTSKWKESNPKEIVWEETSVQMSLAPLKLLTSSGSDSDQWYIVVDADVILKNFNYLNNMAAADPDCHLLVPNHVMEELQIHVSKSSNVQARRVLRFLTQQIESGQAILGEMVDGVSACQMTINTCAMLASQNNNVVLISSNTETFNYRMNAGNVHVFTMQDIKEIIENKPGRIKMFRQNSPTLAVKIVVPNNAIEINVPEQDYISASTSPRMDSTDLAQYDRDISETSLQRTFDSTELANDSQDISGTPFRRMFESTECGNDNRDMSGMTSQRMFDLIERANDNRDISRRIFDATEHVDNTRDIPGASSHKHIDATKQANDTQDILEKPRIMFDATECADDTQDSSGTNSRKSYVSTKVAINAQGISGTTSQRDMNSIGFANDTLVRSGTNSRQSSVSTKVAIDAQEISGATSQRIFDATACANDTRDISRINSQTTFDSTDLVNDARDTSETTSRIIFDSSELNNDAQPKNSKDNLEQNLPNSPVQAKELAATSVCTKSPLKVLSRELYNPDSYQSPSKSIPKSGNESMYLLGMLGNSKKDQSPTKKSDKSSLCSSSASGHVSLDTVGMRNIISMKRLTNTTDNLQKKMRKQPAFSISSNKSENSIKSTGAWPQAINKPSVSRSASYDSSLASGVKGNVSENVVVEETSTSGVISNTNSECSHAEKARNSIQNNRPKLARKNVVMFEVACQSMEDILKTRLDEWLFRFVQIMEEVLRVKLQEKLPDDKEYPAPRDLQEATTCIINKYIENFNIVNAANNLSYILYKTGDEKGKMADNIQPSDYMEMYSYGVFLVDTFLDMSAECKEKDCKIEKTSRTTENSADSCSCYEVKTASESLKKLLYDIQNVNQESFLDLPADISTDNLNPDDSDQYDYEINKSEENIQIPELVKSPYDFSDPEEMQCDGNNTRNSYNLRTQSRGSVSPYNLRTPRRICMHSTEDISTKHLQQGIDVTFFNSLNLRKKDNGSDLNTDDKLNAEENKASHATDQVQTTNGQDKEQSLHNIKIHLNKDDSKKSSFQSKVLCNFTINPDIERKLKAKQNEKEYADNCDNEEVNGEESMVDEQPKQYESEICENNNQINSETNKKSRFIRMLAHNLRIFFTRIKSLCNEYILISHEQSDTRNELHRELEEWCARIGYIHNAFDSVIKREAPMSEDMQTLLKNIANVDYMPDDKLYLENSKSITTLKETVEEFHNRIRRILEMGQGLSP